MKRLKSKLLTITETPYDLVDYEGRDIQIAEEFCVMNLCDKEIKIRFEEDENADELILEPGETFSTQFKISHAIVTTSAVLKFSYWVD